MDNRTKALLDAIKNVLFGDDRRIRPSEHYSHQISR
ncbi:hypothetical protein [Pseudomonas fragi]